MERLSCSHCALTGMAIISCALLLRKRHVLGYLFGTSLFVFLAMMSLSIGGMVVYQISLGMSSDRVVPSVIGGLFFSLVLTLLVIPAMYTFFSKPSPAMPAASVPPLQE